nr:hypothetical protein [Tanacetum cinerariifolium]
MVFVKYNHALYRRCKNIDTTDPILLKDIDENDLTWVAVDIVSGASEPAYPTRALTSRGSVQGSTSASKRKGTAHTSTSDYGEDIGLFENNGVNEELGIDVDDDEDDEDDY